MTAAELSGLEMHVGAWTTDDLDELPESNRRYELIDGMLTVPPSPGYVHQTLVMVLGGVLLQGCPSEYVVTQGVEVRMSKTRSFIPDVLAATAEAAARRPARFAPHEVVLAVEVISPSSVTMDRITKSALYAQAGIPFYWLVETDGGIVVHTHKLDPGTELYQSTGAFDKNVTIDEPWRIDFPISRITP